MSTITSQPPSLFQNVVGFGESSMLPSSPSSSPPNNKRSSDCGSSSGLGMASKNEVSSEASSLTSESATAPPELAFSPPVPSHNIPSNNGPPPGAPFLSPIRFIRPPPSQHQFYTLPNALAAGAALPHSSPNVPPPTANSTASSTTPNSNLPQANGTLQAPSPPNAVIPGIPPNGTPISGSTPGQTNDLFVHVEHGETISLLFGNNEVQHIAGPATIRMVGQSGVNPPLPLHVPRGHNILQICDEKGMLRHLILSPQNAVNMPSNATGLAPPISHHLPQNLSPAKAHTTSASVSTSHPPSTTPNTITPTNAGGHSPPKSTSPPNNMVPSYPPPIHAAGPNASNAVDQNAQSFSSRKRPLPTNKRNGTQPPVSSADTTNFNGTPQENGKMATDSYETVYEGPAEQARINRLEPASTYKARIAAQTESGRSDFSAPVVVNTTIGIQHQPPSLPTTSASTSTMSYYPVYPPMQAGLSAGAHIPLAHYAHIPTPSPIFPPKLAAPTLISVSARSARLSWQPSMPEFGNVTLEIAETSRPFNFAPVSLESYDATRLAANVSGLKSNREYRFRLVSTMANGDIVRSDFTVVKTHKDRYENTAYYQNYQGKEKDRLAAPILQKNYEDDTVIELSWKYQSYEYDPVNYVLEGSTVFTSSTNSSYKDGSDLQWKVCYKGPETAYTVRDVYLVSFRVQAVNKRNIASPWSEVCFAQRTTTVHRSKRQTQPYSQNPRNQYHNQTYSNQQYQTATPSQQNRQSTPPMSQKSDGSVHQEAVESTPPLQLKAPGCTVPKLTNITQSAIDISWKPTTTLNADELSKHSLIYELQRVDKQALIIFSGNETQFHLENLRPVEHVQVRTRAVILDYEGQRTEGDWSSIGSGITLSAVTTPPQNLRLKSEASPFTLSWDAPAQMNGSDVIEYLVNSAHFAMEENKPIDSLALQQIASTERLEYSIDTLLPAHIYIFTVVSRNEAGKSAASERLEFTSPPTPPSPPIQLHLEANSLECLYATWLPSASNGAIVEAYKLTLYYEKVIVVQETVSVETHEYLFENLEAEKEYTLEAQAKNNVGWSKSARVTCSTLQCPPEPPQLSLVQATSNTLKLKWSAVGSNTADSLELLYFYLEKENENGKFLPVYEGENHTAKIKGLRESSAHRFRVRASRVRASPSLAGQWSSVFTCQTLRQPPTGIRSAPTVSEISPGLLQIEWQAYNKGVRDSSGNEESTLRNSYYKLQTAPKGNKGSDNWKTAYQGSSTSCTLNISNSAASTLPTTRQYRVLVVQKHEDEDEVHSLPSPIALFNLQRTPTDSPRKRSAKPTSGQSTPSSLVSARSSSNTNNARVNQSGAQPIRVVPPHKLGLYKRFKRSLLKLSISERDGAFIVLTAFVVLAIGIAFLLNFYYTDKMI